MASALIYCPRCGYCGRRRLRLFATSGLDGIARLLVIVCLAVTAVGSLLLSLLTWPMILLAIVLGGIVWMMAESGFSWCCRQCTYPASIPLEVHERRQRAAGYVPPHEWNKKKVVRDGKITRWT